MTNPNDQQSPNDQIQKVGHWGFVIHWSFGFGHCRAGESHSFNRQLSPLNRHRSSRMSLIFLHPAIMKLDDALAAMRHRGIVCHQDDGFASGDELIEELENLLSG